MDHFEDIIGYEKCYQINRLGQVRRIVSGKILKPANSSGYLCVNLCKNGVRKKYYIHRLLGIQFIPNPENKLEIDHIDRNRQNNSLENLRWATRKEQQNNLSNNVTDYRLNNLKRTRNCNRWRDIKSVFLRILL